MNLVEIKNFIFKPIDKRTSEEAINLGEEYLKQIQQHLQENEAARSELGPWIGKIKNLQKRLMNMEQVDWVALEDGFLAIGHRPGEKLMTDLNLQNATHIFTLLAESEGALKIKGATERLGLGWLWFPMSHAEPPTPSRLEELEDIFGKAKSLLRNGACIYVHCSAGIHRTGMITLALLRYLGYTKENALQTLGKLRNVSSENVGIERQEWALNQDFKQ